MNEKTKQAIMRYVPTLEKLKRMQAVIRPEPFNISGSRTLSVIGVCLCIIGIQAFYLSRCTTRQCVPPAGLRDSTAVAAVDSVSGRMPCCAAGIQGKQSGSVAKTASLFLMVIGVLIALKPHILYYELKRSGLARDNSPRRTSAG